MIDNRNNMMLHCSLFIKVVVGVVCVLSALLLAFSFTPVLGQENTNAIHYPANVTECIEELKRTLPTKGKVLDEFKSHPAEIANDYHLTLGMWIRNNWIHTSDGVLVSYFEKMGIYHPEEMSAIILHSLWRDLHGLSINLQEQVDKYNKFNFYEAGTVRDRRSLPTEIWDKPISGKNGNILKLSKFKGQVLLLLIYEYDELSPVAISVLDRLHDKFSKWNVAVIGLHEAALWLKEGKPYSGPKSKTFPLIDVEGKFIWSLQYALMSPGLVECPELILIGKDGNMIVRFNEWDGGSDAQKELCDEIQAALKTPLHQKNLEPKHKP